MSPEIARKSVHWFLDCSKAARSKEDSTLSEIEVRNGEPLPEPSFAQRARTLVDLGRVGYLSTISQRHAGWPFGSVMPYAADDTGAPLFLISALALHTKNLDADARASLLITQAGSGDDPLAIARLTILGHAKRVEGDVEPLREPYLRKHPRARAWSRFEDFHFYRLGIVDLYYVGGFGVQQWIAAVDFAGCRGSV